MSESVAMQCSWDVYIRGVKLDEIRKSMIESLSWTELCDGSDSLTLVINDPNFIYIDDNIFIEEVPVKVVMQIIGDTPETFEGFISAVDPDFPEEGTPSLSIYCLDNSHSMNRKKKKRTWDKTTNAAVAQIIAKEYGYKCVVQSGYTFKVEDTITQSNQTDIEFLESLAGNEREPFMCKLINRTIYYVKKGLLSEPSARLWYRAYPYDIISFKPQINKETRQESTSSANINTNTKTTDKATANDANTKRATQGKAVQTSSSTTGFKYDPLTKKWSKKLT